MKKDEIKCYIDGKKVNIEKCDGKETFSESFFNDKDTDEFVRLHTTGGSAET